MPGVLLDESKLKNTLKQALVEVLQERSDLMRDIFEEAIEDLALVRAIKVGEKSKKVSRSQVFQTLRAGR
jgi:hypothetical protein